MRSRKGYRGVGGGGEQRKRSAFVEKIAVIYPT